MENLFLKNNSDLDIPPKGEIQNLQMNACLGLISEQSTGND